MASESPVQHPEDWPVVSLGGITLKIGSGATPRGGSETYLAKRHQFAIVRSQNVFDRRFDEDGLAFISDEQAQGLKGVVLRPNDLLLNITGDGITFARSCKVPDDILPACVNQHVSIIRIDPARADSDYVLSYLTHPDVKSYIESFNAGGSRRAITKGHIESFRLALPPIEEQRAIGRFLRGLDDKIELNRKMNETLEAMARALFQSWFVNFDPVRAKAEGRDPGLPAPIAALFPDSFQDSPRGEIPKGWSVGVLDDLVAQVLGGDWGGDQSTVEKSVGVRCIRGADIPDLQRGGTGKMPYRYVKRSSADKRVLNDGDLVIEISGGSPTQSTGRPVLVLDGLLRRLDAPLVCSNFCRFLRLKSHLYAKFVYIWLLTLYADDEFLQFENGTTGIKNLAFTRFSSTYTLVLPPDFVVAAFESRVGSLFLRQQVNAAEAETLSTLRDTLLPKLISGEIRLNAMGQQMEEQTK
jgi:type I restriction enzyme, S subunit